MNKDGKRNKKVIFDKTLQLIVIAKHWKNEKVNGNHNNRALSDDATQYNEGSPIMSYVCHMVCIPATIQW